MILNANEVFFVIRRCSIQLIFILKRIIFITFIFVTLIIFILVTLIIFIAVITFIVFITFLAAFLPTSVIILFRHSYVFNLFIRQRTRLGEDKRGQEKRSKEYKASHDC